VLPRFSGGGAETVTLNLLAGLHKKKYLVGLIVFEEKGELFSLVPNNVPIYNLGTATLRLSIIPLIKKLRILSPKVVFSTFGYINVALLAFRWLLPKKTNIWIREANLPSISLEANPNTRIMKILYRFLYKRSDKLICTSIRMKKEFILKFFVTDSIIDVLPNPVNFDEIRKFAYPVRRFDRGGVCYIAAGRLTFQKGFDRLLDWFSKLNEKNSTLVILGSGDLKCELLKKVQSLNIQNRVKIKDFCNNPWQWYAGADVFLLSSRWEGMPNSVLESLACGVPVISTVESGGILEITKNRKMSELPIMK